MKTTRLFLHLSSKRKQKVAAAAAAKARKPSALAGSIAMLAASAFMLGSAQEAKAGSRFWDPFFTNSSTGGGAGLWDNLTTSNWFDGAVDTQWNNANFDIAIFGGASGGVVTLGSAITAGGLTFTTSGYDITGGTLTLTPPAGSNSPIISVVGIGTRDTISAVLAGTSGFTKTGNGVLRLSSGTGNTIGGDVVIKDGSVVISAANQLGTGTTAISITGIANAGNPGFSGGSLVLQGNGTSASGAGFSLGREVSVSGRGALVANNSGGLISVGYNTLSSGLTVGAAATESRLWATHGTTTISGPVDLGAGNTAIFQGNGNWTITGRITGNEATADRFQKQGQNIGSTLWLKNNTNNFVQGLLVGSGSARVSDNGALGGNVGVAAVDLSNATLEVRSDVNNFSTRSIQFANNATGNVFVDHDVTGSLNLGALSNIQNQTVTFAGMNLLPSGGSATNVNINGRDGSNVTFLAVTATAGDGSPNIVNNSSGTMTLTGNISAISSGTARTLTIQGGGDNIVTGNISPGGTGAHVLTKNGSGTLLFSQGAAATASTFLGNTNVTDGTLAIRTINVLNPTSSGAGRVVFSNGALSFLGDTGTGAGETWTNKTLDLNVASSYLLANQAGSAPTALIIPTNWAAGSTATGKTLFLGGTSTLNNDLSGLITNGVGITNVQKFGTGTWQLDAPTSYGSANAALTITAVGTTASGTITTTSTAGLVVGQPVSGTGFAFGTVISQILSSTQFITNKTAVSTGTTAVIGVASGVAAALTNTTASATGANPILTVASTANLVPGQRVTSTNLLASQNWYIRDITSATTITLVSGTGGSLATAVAISEVVTPVISPNFGGNLIITGGTVRANAGIAAADIINTSSNIQFANDSATLLGLAGGTFEYVGSATAGTLTENVGSLVLSAGAGIVKTTANGGTPTLNMFGYSSRTAGAVVNFQPATVGGIQFANVPTSVSAGLLSGAYITNPTTGSIDFVATPVANTNIAALNSAVVVPTTAGGAANNYLLNANTTTTAAVAANSIRITGAGTTLTLGAALTMTSTSANVEGGILFDNGAGAAKIQGAFNITPSTAGQDLLFIVGGAGGNTAANGLQIGDAVGGLTTLGNATAASVTKAGSGMLILLGGNTYTGNTTIDQGTIRLSGTSAALGTISTAGNITAVRQGATLDVNAAGTAAALYPAGTTYPATNIGALTGAGTVTNSGNGGATQATVNLGLAATSTGTTTFSGTLQDGTGLLNVTVNGTSARSQAVIGAQPYTGITTINTGSLVVTNLADGASGLGNSSNVASNLIFNAGTLVYTGAVAAGVAGGGGIYQTTQTPSVTTTRLFSLAGNATILSNGTYGNESAAAGTGANNASLIFGNTGDVVFLTGTAKTLTLGGTSIGDNIFRPRITDNTVDASATAVTSAGGLWILNPAVANTYTGVTSVTAGQLRAVDGVGIPTLSLITLNGGVLEVAGSTTFGRTLGAAAGNVQLTGGASGFANPNTDRLVVSLTGGAATPIAWGTATFAPTSLVLNSTTALGETEITNNITLNAARTITVNNNANTGSMVTAGILSGVISDGTAAGSITKSGGGVLILGNANTYTGNTTVTAGTVIVSSINTGAGASSLGAAGTFVFNPGDSDLNAFQYVGAGETANRNLTLTASATQTANRNYRIDASGTGALVWNTGTFSATAITENATGRSIVLDLRGSNTDANQMNLVLSNPTGGTNTPLLAINKTDGGLWILNPASPNTFTGTITSAGGTLGLTVNGVGSAGSVLVNNGAIFGFGGALNLPTQLVQGTNSTGVFAGTNSITLGNLAKQAGDSDWTISNNLEGGALLTINNTLSNLTTTTTNRTINFRGFGSTVLAGVLADASTSKTNLSIAIANDASFTMSGASGNTYTGATTLSQGTLNLNKTAGVSQLSVGGTFSFNGGVVQAGSALTGANALPNAIILTGDPATFAGANSIDLTGGLTNSGATRLLVNNLPTLTFNTGAVNLSESTTARSLTILGSGQTIINSVVQNSGAGSTNGGGLTYSGTGSLVLAGANTATGALTVNRSTTTINGATGTWAGTVALNSTGTLTLDNTGATVNRLSDTLGVTGNGGTLNFIGEAAAGSTEVTGALTLSNTVSTIAMNVTGGVNILNFTTVTTPNTGSSLDLSSIANLGSGAANGNQVLFSGTAPTLTNGINTRIFVNGGADFATHGATGVIAFTGYNNSNNLNTAAITDTMNLTASAATTANRTVNAVKINGTGISLSGAATNRLTLGAAGVINTGGNNSLDITEVAFAANAAFVQVASGTTLTVNSGLTGSGGFSKVLSGGVNFGAGVRSFITSTHNLMGGTVTLNGGADTFFPNQAFNVPSGGTLNLNGGGQYINSLTGQAGIPNAGGSVNGGGLLVIGSGGGTFGGVISSGTALARVGGGTLTLETAQLYTGTTLLMAGTTTLENNATLANGTTPAIGINNATLFLSNNSGLQTQNSDRIGNAIPLNLKGGTISVTGRVSTAATETFGALNLLEGSNTITATATLGTIASMDLTFASLSRAANQGTTVNFTGTNLGQQGNNARIMFTSPLSTILNGALGAWAIANSGEYAAYNTSMGIGVVGQGGYLGYRANFASGNITEIPSAANTALNLTAGLTTTGLLKISGAFTNDITFSADSNVLQLENGGLLRSNSANNTTIGVFGANKGILTAGTAATVGVTEFHVYNAQGTTTINSVIADTSTAVGGVGTVRLVKSAAGTLSLTALNTYTGGTIVNSPLTLNGPGTAGIATYVVLPAGGLTINNGTVTEVTNQGQIAPTNVVTLRGGSTLTLVGANTLDSVVFDNNGGTAAPTVTTGGALTLTNSTPITVTSSNVGSVATIAGSLLLPSGAQTLLINPIQVAGITVSNLTPTLNISAAILSTGTSLTKTGTGLLQLGGQSTYNGLTVSTGGIVLGASSTPTAGSIASGPLGLGPVTMAAGTTLLTSGTFAVANPFSFASTPTFDSTANTVWTMTLNGTLSGAGFPGTTLTANVINPGLTVALLGNMPAFSSVIKNGLGTLIFSANNYTGDFNASALGNPNAVSLLADGNGTGQLQSLLTGSNVVFDAGIVPNITVGRAGGFGGSSPFILSANKTMAPASVSNLALGITVTNGSGDGLRVADSATFANTPTISVSTATASNVVQGLTLSGVLSGAAGTSGAIFNKIGSGTLVLSNPTNSFTGNINIQAGVVSVDQDAELGNVANLIQLNPGAATTGLTSTFRATGTFTLGHTLQLSNATANTRTIEVTGANTLTFANAFDVSLAAGAALSKADTGTLALNVANPTWTGVLTISQGAVTLGDAGALGTTAGNTVVGASGAALRLPGGMTLAEPLSLSGSGIQSAGALQATGAGVVESGAITLAGAAFIGADGGATLSLTGGISGAQALSFVGAGSTTLTTTALGAVSSVTKMGSGTTTLGVNSTGFIGALTVNNGTFVLGSAGAGTLGITGAILVNPTGIFTVDNTTGPVARLGIRPLTLAGGTFNYNTASAAPFTETAGILTLNQGQSTLNLTNSGGSLTTNTFASLAFGTNSSANVTGLNIATSQLKFTAAPALTPVTTGILPRLIVNGSEFATYSATNGVVPFTAYAAAINILSVAPTQTFKATPSTLNSLTSNQTINALTLDSVNSTVAVGGLGGNPPATLTLTSGAILAKSSGTGTQEFLNVPIVALGAEGLIHVQSGQTLTVTSAFTGTAGMTKALPGTLNLNAQQFVSGTTAINSGSVFLAPGVTNTLLFNNALAVNAGGTLDLNGTNQFVAGLSTQAGGAGTDLGGGTVTNTGALSTLTVNGSTNFGGVISGNIHLNKTGTGALNFTAPQTYTGKTLITGGTLNLNDSASLPNTAQPIEIRHGALAIGDANLISGVNRVNDTAPITLTGGTIAFSGRAQTASSETLGAVTLAGGHSSFTTGTGGTGINSLDVTIASLARTDNSSTIRFNAGGQIGSAARLMITAAPTLTNNIIGAWAVSDRDFASYDSVYGVGRLNDIGFANYSTIGLAGSPTSADNVRLATAGTTTLGANTTVNTLTFGQQTTATVLNLGGNDLVIQGGGIMFGQTTDNIDFSITNGNLRGPAGGGDLFLHHGSFGGTGRTVTIGAAISDNGGAVRAIFAAGSIEATGIGNTILMGANNYTGGTVINSGNVVLGNGVTSGTLGTGGITVNNGFLTQTVAATGLPSQALTLNGGGVVTLAGNNSLTNLTVNNNGGAAPTLNPTGVLTLTGGAGIAATVSSPGTIATIAGGTVDLNANATYPISVGAAIINGADVAPWQAGLNITSIIQNGGIVKSGAGVLGLSSAASTFTGGVSVTAGGISLGASSTPSAYSGTPGSGQVITSGPVGTGVLTLANNTTVVATTAVAIANNVTITDNGFGVGNNVFNGTNNVSFNGVTTLPATWNATVTAPQMTVTIADATPSLATDNINKSGPGILTVGNYAGTINVAGGLTFLADGNGLGTVESINLGGNVVLTGDTAIAVKNSSSPNARNKTIQKVNLTDNGSIISVVPSNGYGLEFTGTTTFTGASHVAVGVGTASNVVQGLTLSGVVSDTGGFSLVKSGPGTLALTNAGNTFGGVGATIDVLNGVLSVSSDGALGNINNTITLEVDGATGLCFRATGPSWSTSRLFNMLQPANAAFEVTAGTVFGINTAFVITTPTITINKNDNGVLQLLADNSATGWNNTTNGLNITAGAVRLSNNGAAGTATNRIVVNTAIGAALQLANNVTISQPLSLNNVANEPLRGGLNSGGHLESVSGINTYAGLIATVFDASIGADAGSTLNLTGGIDNTGNRRITFVGDGTVNLSSAINLAPFQMDKYGAGTLNFTTAQTAAIGNSTGLGLQINAGTVSFNQAGQLNVAAVGGLNVNPGATLEVNDNSAVPTNNRLGISALTLKGGNLNIIGSATGTTVENLGTPTFSRGYSIITLTADPAQQTIVNLTAIANNVAQIQNAGPSGASVLFRGSNLGTAAAPGVAVIFDNAGFTFNGSTVGATGANTHGILPWAIVETTVGGTGATAQFATGDAAAAAATTTAILRPLNTSTEMATNTAFAANVNERLTANVNVTASVTPNSVTLESGGQITVTPFQTLSLASGGILAKTGNAGISGGILSQLSTASPFNIWAVDNTTITSLINGGNGTANANVGFIKAGAGTLTLTTPTSAIPGLSTGINSMSGQTAINQGTLKLNGGTNTIQANNFLEVGVGGTLDLNGNTQQVLSIFTDGATSGTAANAGGIITTSTGTGNLIVNQDNAARNWAGSIQGSVNFTRSGQNTMSVYAPQTYTGTTLINGNTTILRDTASLSGTTAIDINYATLSADNAVGTVDSTNRINDAAAITLRGGTLTIQGRAQVASSEALGAVSVNQGFNVINPLVGGTGVNSIDVSLASLSRPAGSSATLIVQGTALGTIGSNSRVTVGTLNGVATTPIIYSANGSGLTNNIVGGWAENGNDFLTYIPGLGLAPLNQSGAPQYDLTNTFVLGTGTKNVRLTATTNINAGGINVNAVSMTGSAISLTFTNATDTLNITSGGLIGPNNNQTIGAALDSGRLTAGGLTPAANSDLYVFNRANTLTINSRIIDNVNGGGSAVRSVFTASGGAITLVNPNNSYTGGTVLNGGTLNLTNTAATAVIPAGGLTINTGAVTMNNFAGQIAAANVVTMNGGGSTLNLFGNNTLAGLVLNNIGGGASAVQVNTFALPATGGSGTTGVLTIGASGIVATSSNVTSQDIIVGRTDFGASAGTVQVDPINAQGVDVNPLTAAFAIQGIVGTSGGITKTGNGVMAFNAQAQYTGATTVNAGTIRLGVQNGGSRNSALVLNGSTTALNLSGTSTTFGSLAGSGTVFNSGGANTLTVGFNNTPTTFSGQLSRFNDATLNATGLQKIGTGVMTMTGVQLFSTGTTGTITVNGGTIKYLDSGAAFPATTVSGGATINVNNGGTLALDNTGTTNVNNRLGMSTAGTLAIQGGKLTINGTSTVATPTTETITTFNVTNGGGRVELTPDPTNALNLAITTLSTANGNGSLVIGGINGSAVGTVGQGVLTITNPNLIAGQGTGLNGFTTMAVRHDILGDAAIGGLGTGFLVKDTAAGGTYRALASGELAPTILLPLATGAATTNVGLVGATQALTVNSLANTLTISGSSTVNGLGATFGNYSPGGGLLNLQLSAAAASLTLAGATGNINVGNFGSTAAGTTIYSHVIAGGTLNINGAFGVANTGGLAKADGGALTLNNFAYYTGTTTINDGTVKLASGAANTIAVVPTAGGATVSQLNLNGTGAILDLNGQSQAIGTLTSINPLPGQGGTIQNAGAAATLTTSTQAASGSFGGVISGNIALTRAGANTTTLTNANTYTGATIVRGGTLQLRDSGSISSTAGLTLNYGTLNWDNFGLNPLANPTPTRVAATNAVTLQGGTITINGAGSTDTVVTLNSVTATGGQNTVNIFPFINEGSTAKLTIGSLVRSQSNHSGVNFNGNSPNNSSGTTTTGGQGLTANGNIILNSLDFSMANAVTTAASNIVTVPSTAGLFVGALVTGTGLPVNERITAITSATTFTVTTATGVTAQASTTLAATSPLINLTITGGSTTLTSNIVTVPSTAGLFVGAPVTGTGLPTGEFITAITSGTTFTVTTATGVTAATGTTFTANNLNNNLIGGWAVADGNTFATYVSGNGVFTNNGVSVMGQTTQGIVAPAFTATTVAGATVATGNYSEAGATISLASGAVVANSWRFAPGAAQAITFPTTTTAALNVGVIANAAFTTTLTATDATNTLSGTGTDLFFYVNQNTLIVQPAITGASALVSNGPATLSLRPTFANNTYTGGTFVQNGTLNLQAVSPFIAIPGNLTVNNGAVTMGTVPNQIATASSLSINGGGSVTLGAYTTGPTQTLNSVTFTNEGGTGNPTLSLGTPTTAVSTLILSSATPITSTNNSIATTPLISTGAATLTALQFSAANPVITVTDGLAETELVISAPITQHASMTTLSKTGTGVLALSGASTFTTGFNLNQGGLMFGAGSTGGPVTSGPVGTGTLVIAGGTSLLSDGTLRTIGNATTVNGDFTFGGRVAGNGVILSGAMNLGAVGRTITVTSPAVTSTISGVITGATTGTALTKAGAGTLVLSGATNSFANVAITGGILKNGIDNAIPATSAISVAVGTGYDLNNFNETLDSISGLGFITQSAAATKTLTVSSTVNSSTFSGILTDNVLGNAASHLALIKLGTPTTLTLSGANTYSGATTVTSGIVSISNGSGLGTTAAGTTVIGGGSLELQGGITVGAETLSIAGTGSTGANGALRNLNGTNVYGGTVTLTAPSLIQSDLGLLTLSNVASVTGAGQNLTVGGAGSTTISGTLATTTGSLTKNDGGTLTINGNDTRTTGTTTVNGGILAMNATSSTTGATSVTAGALNIGAAGSMATTAVTVSSGATFSSANTTDNTAMATSAALVNNGTVSLVANQTIATLNGASTGNLSEASGKTLTVSGGGTYSGTINGAGANLTVTGGTLLLNGGVSNTYTGLTTVTGGTLSLGMTAGNAIAGPGGTPAKSDPAKILVNGGTLSWAGNNQVGDQTRIDITSGSVLFNTFNENIYNLVNSGGTVDYGTGTVNIADPTWNSGTNTISGTTSFGELNILGGTNTINAGASLTVGAATTGLNFQGTGSPDITITSSGGTAGVLKLTGAGGNVTVDSTVTVATITSGGAGLNPGRLDLNGAVRTFTVNNAGGGLNVSAQIIGASGSGLTKAGSGTMTVTAADNTYTGATTITGGQLTVTGKLSGTTSVDVSGGGTLLMSGGANSIGNGSALPDTGTFPFNTVSGAIGGANVSLGTVSTTGTLAVATGAGGNNTTHSFGTLTLNGNAILDFSSGGGANANVNLFFNGQLAQNGNTLTINNWNPGSSAYGLGATTDGGTWGDNQDRLLFTTSLGFGQGTLLTGISFNLIGGTVGAQEVMFGSNFEIVPVPEPATTALIGSVALCALIGYRERRRFTGIRNRQTSK